MKLGEFLAAVKRYRWTFVITVGTVLALGLIWLVLTPAKYVSTTRLMVSLEGSTTADAYQNDDVVAGRINTYIGLLTSDVVSQRVVDKLKLPESPRELADIINATAVQPRTSLIDIEVTDSSPERAQQIAQTVADQFVLYAEAIETPTGQDGQKVHTTVVTAATPPQGNALERNALGGLLTLAALLAGASAVWIRSSRDPELQLVRKTAAGSEPYGATEMPFDPESRQAALALPGATEPPTGDQFTTSAETEAEHAVASTPPKTIDLVETYRRLRARLGSVRERGIPAADQSAADAPTEQPSKTAAPPVAEPTRPVTPVAGRHTTDRKADADTRSPEAGPADADAPADGAHLPDGHPGRSFEPAASVSTNGTAPGGKAPAPFRPAPQKTVDLVASLNRLGAHFQPLIDRARQAVDKRKASRSATSVVTAQEKTRTRVDPRPAIEPAESSERTPWLLGFLFVLSSVIPGYLVPAGPLKSNGSPAKLIAIMCFGLAVLGFVLVRRTRTTRVVQPGVILILLFFLLQLLVYGVGMINPGDAILQASKTRAILNLLANVGLVLFILVRIKTSRQRTFLLGCLAIGLAYNCTAGLLQSMTHIDLRFYLQPPGFVFNTDELDLAIRGGVKRVLGTTLHPIEFSLVAAVTVPLAIYFAGNAAKRWTRVGAMFLCVLALISMPAAVSRTGVIGIAVALFVYMWYFNVRQIATALAVGTAMLVSYAMIAPSVTTALWATITGAREDDSIAERISDYAQVSRTFREHPLFGLGLGGAPPAEYGVLDNEWLQALVQGGLLGVTAMLVIALGGILGFAAALRSAATSAERNQAYALGSMFMGVLVCSYFFDLFSFVQAARILFISFALMWSTYTIPISPPATLETHLPKAPPRRPVLAMRG